MLYIDCLRTALFRPRPRFLSRHAIFQTRKHLRQGQAEHAGEFQQVSEADVFLAPLGRSLTTSVVIGIRFDVYVAMIIVSTTQTGTNATGLSTIQSVLDVTGLAVKAVTKSRQPRTGGNHARKAPLRLHSPDRPGACYGVVVVVVDLVDFFSHPKTAARATLRVVHSLPLRNGRPVAQSHP